MKDLLLTDDHFEEMESIMRSLDARGLINGLSIDALGPRDFEAIKAEADRRLAFYQAFYNDTEGAAETDKAQG